IGRPEIREIQAIPSTDHGMLKFPVDGGIVTICSTILIPAECATLNIGREGYSPVQQKKIGQAPERVKAIQEEMAEPDEEKTTFHTIHGVYCYTKMPFGKLLTTKAVEETFLGYMISPEGIKLCQDKTEAVLRLPSPWTIKEVQSLNGKLASLNRFLSKSAKKSLPLFKTLKKCIKKSDFH
ncbi:hypothetical protein Tco_1411689, partial [Tanacetum coccineum]